MPPNFTHRGTKLLEETECGHLHQEGPIHRPDSQRRQPNGVEVPRHGIAVMYFHVDASHFLEPRRHDREEVSSWAP